MSLCNLGKVVREVPENHEQPANMHLCTDDEENKAAHGWWDPSSPWKTEGELPVRSDKLYEGTPFSQQPQGCMTASTNFLQLLFIYFFYICFRSFTEQTWNFMSLFVIFNMCIDFPSSKLCWANIRLLPRWIKIMGNRSLPIKLPFNFNNIDLTRKRNAWRNISSRTGFPC